MTEPVYLASEDPDALFAAVGGGLSRRKLILFACGCLRLVPFKITDRKTRRAIEVIEQFAEGLVPVEDIIHLSRESHQGISSPTFRWAGSTTSHLSHAVRMAIFQFAAYLCDDMIDLMNPVGEADNVARWVREATNRGAAAQARLFRELAGNPFRPVAFDPVWRTAAVVGLAEAVQADRAFDRLPILADALEDAGCDAGELLAHFRGPGVHARGCWALDLVLGKA